VRSTRCEVKGTQAIAESESRKILARILDFSASIYHLGPLDLGSLASRAILAGDDSGVREKRLSQIRKIWMWNGRNRPGKAPTTLVQIRHCH